MKLRLLLLLSLFQWSFSCFSVQAITTPWSIMGKYCPEVRELLMYLLQMVHKLSLRMTRDNIPYQDTSNAEDIYITLPDGYNIPDER